MMESTEDAVFNEVDEMGPATAKEIAVALALPESTVRRHLHKLENTGRVESDNYARRDRVWMLP